MSSSASVWLLCSPGEVFLLLFCISLQVPRAVKPADLDLLTHTHTMISPVDIRLSRQSVVMLHIPHMSETILTQ